MVRTSESGYSAMWDKEVTIIFCDLCIKEIELGNRPTTYFNKEGWQKIGARFKELTGRDYNKLKFKNKWDQLKKECKLWKELKRGSTGLGWDPIKRTIDASDEWWTEKLKVMPTAKKYRHNGIDPEFEDKLDIMFKGVVATGKTSMNPSEMEFSDIPDEHYSGDVPSINQKDMGESSTMSKRAKVSKRTKDKDSFFKSSFHELIEAFSAPPPPDSTIFDCVAILETIPEVAHDIRFQAKCVKKLEDPTRRQLFMAVRPEARLEYLRLLIEE